MHFEPWCALAGVSACVHPLVGVDGGWGQNVTKHYLTYNGNKTPIQKKSTGWRLRYGFRQWDAHEQWNLLQTNRFNNRPVKVSIHKTLNSSRGVIRCRDLADMSEVEIRDELRDQGVVGVKKEGEVIPTNTLFLTFGSPDLPKEITVGYLKVKVALFVPNPMRCFNCNKFGYTSQRCKVAAKCPGCGKDKHEGRCEGPKLCSNCNGPHASSAKDCPVWQKEKEIQRVLDEKRISFPEARQLVEAKMPTVVSGGKTYAAAASTRRESKSVECQTCLTWGFSERPHRTPESNVRSYGGPGSVSTSGKSATCSSEICRVSANPHKMASKVQGLPPKAHLRVQQVP